MYTTCTLYTRMYYMYYFSQHNHVASVVTKVYRKARKMLW